MSIDREALGRMVRETWITWAKEQSDPRPWLFSWKELTGPEWEAHCRIGERLFAEGQKQAEAEVATLKAKLASSEAACASLRAVLSCRVCGRPATCVGTRDSLGRRQFACDGCCGHGQEEDEPCELLPTAGRAFLDAFNGMREAIVFALETMPCANMDHPLHCSCEIPRIDARMQQALAAADKAMGAESKP